MTNPSQIDPPLKKIIASFIENPKKMIKNKPINLDKRNPKRSQNFKFARI